MKHTYSQVCEACGGGLCELHDQIKDMPDPMPYRETIEHETDEKYESKMAQALFQVIQADERTRKWGERVKLLETRIAAALAYCKQKDQWGKDVNPAKVIHILEGDNDPKHPINPYGSEKVD